MLYCKARLSCALVCEETCGLFGSKRSSIARLSNFSKEYNIKVTRHCKILKSTESSFGVSSWKLVRKLTIKLFLVSFLYTYKCVLWVPWCTYLVRYCTIVPVVPTNPRLTHRWHAFDGIHSRGSFALTDLFLPAFCTLQAVKHCMSMFWKAFFKYLSTSDFIVWAKKHITINKYISLNKRRYRKVFAVILHFIPLNVEILLFNQIDCIHFVKLIEYLAAL